MSNIDATRNEIRNFNASNKINFDKNLLSEAKNETKNVK